MVAIPRSKRFVPRAVNKYIFCPTVAAVDPAPAPTKAEMDGGTDLTNELFAVDGFSTSTTFVESSDVGTQFKGKLPAGAEAADATMTFNASQDGLDVRTILEEGQRGYMVIGLGGAEIADKVDVYEVVIGSVDTPTAADETAKVVVSIGVPSKPNKGYAVPAV